MNKKLLFLIFVLFFTVPVYAVPKTFTRSNDNLLLPKDVNISNVNINDVLKTPAVDASAKIYDFADLLTDAEESKVYMQLNEFIKNTGLDSAIVLINNLNGYDMKNYSYNFYDFNNFENDGVIFVLYVSSDKKSIYIANSGPASSDVYIAYTDNVILETSKYVYENYVAKEDYLGACETYIKIMDGFYIKAFGEHKVGDLKEKKDIPWITMASISLVLTFIIMSIVYTKYQKPKRIFDISMKKSLDDQSMVVKCEYDRPTGGK